MGDLTLCNYCSLRNMRAIALKQGVYVILDKDEYGWTSARYSNQTEPSAWFMVLTESCVC